MNKSGRGINLALGINPAHGRYAHNAECVVGGPCVDAPPATSAEVLRERERCVMLVRSMFHHGAEAVVKLIRDGL